MKPYYQDGQVTLYNGDCAEIVPTLGTFDLLLTDPPYGLGDRWTGAGTWQGNIIAEAKVWDKNIIEQSFMNYLTSIVDVAIVWGGNYYQFPAGRCWLAWDKPEKMHTVADFELAWTNIDKPAKMYTVSRHPDGRREHPTQKPIRLMRWCIWQAGDNINTILDPFAGSGTTGRAAKDLGKQCTLIEREEKYCEIIVRRMAQECLF